MSSDKDFVIGVTGIPAVGVLNKKPAHLVLVDLPEAKNKCNIKFFISLDRPVAENGFITVKGIFYEASEEDICKNYNEVIATANKESIEEVMFPLFRIVKIKNLVFKAK